MKVLFICGSVESGRDGVGDYTIRLARELSIQGHEIAIIALYDRFVTTVGKIVEAAGTVDIPLLRIASSSKPATRVLQARKLANDFNPEWISLQFVPFSFHEKGLPLKLGRELSQIGFGRKWAVMFHELWVGMAKGTPLKHYWLGLYQRHLIQRLLLNIKPAAVQTHTRLYQAKLETLGVNSVYLPLYSNIPNSRPLSNKISQSAICLKKTISFIAFGTLHEDTLVEPFAKEVSKYANKNGIKIILKVIGRSGVEQKHWVSVWNSNGIEVRPFGERPVEFISEELFNSSFGLTTTPLSLCEKSGTVAAMWAHGLPVLCIAKPWHSRGKEKIDSVAGVSQYVEGNLEEILQVKKAALIHTIQEVAKAFINQLEKTVNG